jgi:uncharacterized protein (DUF1800 family)
VAASMFTYSPVVGDDVALLLRRAGFGPREADLSAASMAGYAATLSALTSPAGADAGAASSPVPQLGTDLYAALRNPTAAQSDQAKAARRTQSQLISQWWLDRMTVADHQAVEKLLFFWHGHWATSIARVGSPQLMLAQHLALRLATDFRDMAHRMVVDPALIVWLDGHENRLGAPNENLARELMELFTLGIGHYTETDIKEAARALTGWRVDAVRTRAFLDLGRHDAGPTTILGSTGTFTAASLVDLLLAQPACPRFIASRLWFRYASSTVPLPADLREKTVAAFPAPMSMLQIILNDPAFAETRGTLVRQPIEWLVGAMRQLGLRPATMSPKTVTQLMTGLERLGQRPFAPPSVGGWPAGVSWLTSAAMSVKMDLAYTLAGLAEVDALGPDGAAQLLCLDGWTNRTYSVLRGVGDPRRLLALALVSPEYLVT